MDGQATEAMMRGKGARSGTNPRVPHRRNGALGTAPGGQAAVHANPSCPEVIATVQATIAAWGVRFWQSGWYPTQWAEDYDGVNGTLPEVFVTDTRQQVLAAYERDAP